MTIRNAHIGTLFAQNKEAELIGVIMTATDAQIRHVMRERNKGKTQEQAAVSANLASRKTVAKYEQSGRLPSELKTNRTYRTRVDPFSEDWDLVEGMLRDAPELEAKVLFDWLCEQNPGRYQAGQMRTFQRRVSHWKGLNREKVATLDQVRVAGEMMQLDGTWLTELGVTIAGQPFKHLLIHCVLPYSNWEWGRIAQSESLGAVRMGLQSALEELGHVPQQIQTDNSSAATRQLGIVAQEEAGKKREYTVGWQHVCDHYGIEPRSTHVGNPNENGDVEASNGALKRALKQAFLLRGNREFESIEVYETFLFEVMRRRNKGRQVRVTEEIEQMKPLKATRLSEKMVNVKVNSASLIRIKTKAYSLPTSLIGKRVTVYLHEWSLDVYLGTTFVTTIPRIIGAKTHHVNYRHVIGSLLKKCGGFRQYRYRNDLFPQQIFRQAWEQLDGWHSSHKADLTYLRVLHLAATEMEHDVAAALHLVVERGEKWDERTIETLVKAEKSPKTAAEWAVSSLETATADLTQFDQLFGDSFLQEVLNVPS